MLEFQSTHLLRGATNERDCWGLHCYDFNPRTSYEVRLCISTFVCYRQGISIHAPLTRCDPPGPQRTVPMIDFNPRTSYEVRQYTGDCETSHTRFQSTHLLRGATQRSRQSRSKYRHFNPRTSYEVRRSSGHGPAAYVAISIHAPLTRCDCSPNGTFTEKFTRFQSTHLLRGATFSKIVQPLAKAFQSTHLLRGATH